MVLRGGGAMWRLAYVGLAVLACCSLAPSVDAQSDEETCDEVTVKGLTSTDSFPQNSTVYTDTADESATRGTYVTAAETFFIWYSPTDPTEYTSDTAEAGEGQCSGFWVISSYPVGDVFEDTVWYQTAINHASCETSPADIPTDVWLRAERGCSTSGCEPEYTDKEVTISCVSTEEDGDSDGESSKTVIALIIVGGVGFMVLMCLGALACCIRGKNSPEEAIMPPGELTDGSAIGAKAGQDVKPGLHAHPEIEGSSQHPRPEGWAPSYASNSHIPQGSRSGPSVRSIGYT